MNEAFKIVFLFIVLFLLQKTACNQEVNSFKKGSHTITLGHGYKSWYQAGTFFYEYFYEKTFDATGPLHIKYEYGLSNKIGVGFSIAYHKYKDIHNQPVLGYRLIGRMNYHFPAGKRWDPYFDIGIGAGKYKADYVIVAYPPQVITDRKLIAEIELGIGTRYYFTKKFGLYLEAGIGKTLFHGGLVLAL